MKNLLISLIVSAGLMSVAHAGDAEAGKALSATCAACHGADGNSLSPAFPKIAGQGERYLIKQITEIRDGARPVPTMQPFVMNLTDQNIADLAAYYTKQAPSAGGAKAELVELGERIYRAGIEEKGVPACQACHMADGSGLELAGFPRLAGQHDQYTSLQLHNFSAGERNNDQAAMMRTIAQRMHDKEIEAVSSYIQGLR
ncbi:cytochrome c4 [Bacterioplanes sanyensis]|uniref:Cytochrome c4 n=1 Tax=Bacterioplanes sanyensis TaxID=1249553 RepID=A0A222FGE4_9GAMM|nr:c-type cytochrome [Bacterioplanes sanyensis]ASP38068.1 cytochrome c4 [Bacterioplanes sanyensis]